MQRLTDQLVGDVRAVVVAGVDVVHTGRDGLTQYGQCGLAIPGRPEYAGAGQLHGTVAKSLDEQVTEAECAGKFNTGHGSPDLHPAIDHDDDTGNLRRRL